MSSIRLVHSLVFTMTYYMLLFMAQDWENIFPKSTICWVSSSFNIVQSIWYISCNIFPKIKLFDIWSIRNMYKISNIIVRKFQINISWCNTQYKKSFNRKLWVVMCIILILRPGFTYKHEQARTDTFEKKSWS